MSRTRVFISVPKENGDYESFQEITNDVLEKGITKIKQQLDSNEYDIGTIRFNKITLTLRNDHSKFSEPIDNRSIFRFTKDKSIVRVLWDKNTNPDDCGSAPCGHFFLSQPVEIYEGLIDDSTSKQDYETQTIKFDILSKDYILGKTEVPFLSLSVADDAQNLIFKILNQTEITKFLNVDISNINLDNNFTPDAIDSLENKTCLEGLQDILLLANSILYVDRNDNVIISPRNASAQVINTFYGSASAEGNESIINIKNYTDGLNRTFNFLRWKDTNLTQSFLDSREKYGTRIKEIESDLLTDNAKRLLVLNKILNEFGFPKVEMDLLAPISTPLVLNIFFLSKVKIDLPAEVRDTGGEYPAIYGPAVYGVSNYAFTYGGIVIPIGSDWKVMNIETDLRGDVVIYRLRGV